jgi:hypothetical protein
LLPALFIETVTDRNRDEHAFDADVNDILYKIAGLPPKVEVRYIVVGNNPYGR